MKRAERHIAAPLNHARRPPAVISELTPNLRSFTDLSARHPAWDTSLVPNTAVLPLGHKLVSVLRWWDQPLLLDALWTPSIMSCCMLAHTLVPV